MGIEGIPKFFCEKLKTELESPANMFPAIIECAGLLLHAVLIFNRELFVPASTCTGLALHNGTNVCGFAFEAPRTSKVLVALAWRNRNICCDVFKGIKQQRRRQIYRFSCSISLLLCFVFFHRYYQQQYSFLLSVIPQINSPITETKMEKLACATRLTRTTRKRSFNSLC